MAVTLVVFYLLLAIWCFIGWAFVRVPFVAKTITDYGRFIVPALLVGLGLYIFLGNNTQTLLGLPPIK
jgi:cadmium resistance protein CadD (predicted permease)